MPGFVFHKAFIFLVMLILVNACDDNKTQQSSLALNRNDDDISKKNKDKKKDQEKGLPVIFDKAKCKKAADDWMKAYSSSSPFKSWNKTTPWPFVEKEIKAILAQETSVSFGKRLKLKGKGLSEFTASIGFVGGFFASDESEKQAELFEIYKKRDERDETLLKNIDRVVSRATEEDIVFIYAGGAHIVDYFLSKKHKNSVRFINQKIDEGTYYYDDGIHEINNKLGKRYKAKNILELRYFDKMTVGYNAAAYHIAYLARLSAYVDDGYNYTHSNILSSRSSGNPSSYLIADIHHMNSTALADDLPDGRCMQHRGIKSITIGLEGIPLDKTLSYEEVKQIFVHNYSESIIKVDAPRAMLEISMTDNKLYSQFKEGKISKYPNIMGMIDVLEEASKFVTIKFVGIE
jgi:hypothetical protein